MFDWGRVWLIARRELLVRFRQRSYRWATIVQLVIAAVIALAPVLVLKFLPDTVGESDQGVVAVVDDADANLVLRMPLYLAALAGEDEEPLEARMVDSADEARTLVDNGDVDAALVATRNDDGEMVLDLITEDGNASSARMQQLISAASAVVMEDRIEESGLSTADVEAVFGAPDVTVTSATGEVGDDEGIDFPAYIMSFIATILLFLAVVLYGQWIATGVVEEKSSRIMEIMVNAATPRDLLAGKVIGIMLAAIFQFGPMLLVGGLIFGFLPQIGDLMGVDVGEILDIDFGQLTTTAIASFLVYFIFGFILYGSLYAGVGSLVSRQEEVSTVIAPLSFVMFAGYFAAFATMDNPDGTLARVAFLVPFTSPFVGVARILLGNPSATEIALSIGLLVFTVLGAMWLAGRLYRIGVLMYGQRPGFKTMLGLRKVEGVAR